MRTFIALDLDDALCNEIRKIQVMFRNRIPQVKASWVRHEHFHLTTHFTGELDLEKVGQIKTWLSEHMINLPKVPLSKAQAGVFPNWKNPRVFWIGFSGTEILIPSLELLGAFLLDLGVILEEKPFVPHVTLCRFKETIPREAVLSLQDWNDDSLRRMEGSVRSLTFYQSQLSSSGSVYTPIIRLNL